MILLLTLPLLRVVCTINHSMLYVSKRGEPEMQHLLILRDFGLRRSLGIPRQGRLIVAIWLLSRYSKVCQLPSSGAITQSSVGEILPTVINFRLDALLALRSICLSPWPPPPSLRFLRWQQNWEQQRGKQQMQEWRKK